MSYYFFLAFLFYAKAESFFKPQINGVLISQQLQSPEKTFSWLDADKTGTISFDEYLKADLNYVETIKKEFSTIDTNHDGKISKDEYEDHFDATLKEIMEKQIEYSKITMKFIDKNFDEKLNVDEFGGYIKSLSRDPASSYQVFQEFDYDKDGLLNIEELRLLQFQFPFDKFPVTKISSDNSTKI